VSLPTLAFKLLALGSLNALAVWAMLMLAAQRNYWLIAVLATGCLLIDYVFLSPKAYPWRYVVPGLIFMTAMVVYPIGYTAVVAFTNYGTGNLLTREQVIANYEGRLTLQPDMPEYSASFYRSEAGHFAVVLTDERGGRLLAVDGEIRPFDDGAPAADGSTETDGSDGTEAAPLPEQVGEYRRLGAFELFQYLGELQHLEFEQGDYVLKMRSTDKFATYESEYHYDASTGSLVDSRTGEPYTAVGGKFTSADGTVLDVGYREWVGWANFVKLVRSSQVAGPFVRVFVWTFTWAFLSVFTTFAMGLALAILLNDKKMKFKGFYRVLLIVPYAMPAFISALVWRGLLNTEVGLVNNVLQSLIGLRIPWLQDPFWAKASLILVNLWLGFPYMMIITLGSLQSIPDELYEAARVDGATGWQQFRKITLPLLLVSVAPLLVSSFAFNFNNFGVIYLLTKGRPPIPGAATPAGYTDILITYTYRLAFESSGGADYGLASAVTILIFLIVATLSWMNFRFTGALEEVRENA